MKSLSWIVLISFINLISCASTQTFTVSEYQQYQGDDEVPDGIRISTKDGLDYDFSEQTVVFKNDTLFVNGMLSSSPEQPVEMKFAAQEIESIRSHNQEISGGSFLIVLAIAGALYLLQQAISNTYTLF
jgi:hypothetical protein